MENNDINMLISSFKEYRDLISPIQQNLQDFSVVFENMKDDISKLNSSFGGDVQGKLDNIYKDLSSQAEKSKGLANQIDQFSKKTNEYTSQVDKLIDLCSNIETKIKAVDELKAKAESQIGKLDEIIEEKKKNYDVKQLEKNLEIYNVSVQKVSEYINKDVADSLKNNNEKIKQISDKNDSVLENLIAEKQSIEGLVENYKTSNEFLKKIVENNEINKEYIFDILDGWAKERNIKIKK